MIRNSKDKDFSAAKQEATGDEKLYKAPSSSSRQWSSAGLRNPRIVRVSRTFGGKDRHSKVCTVRGLRDRRIRLSVPTAVQLYDLQDRLGLSQPSHGIALPPIDGSHNNLVSNSLTTSPFNSPSIQSMSQLFFCGPPSSNSTPSPFGSPYPPAYLSTHENPHDSIRSQIINNHVQMLSASTSSTSASSSSSQQFHVLNNPLMSSLHSTSTTSAADNNPPLLKSFPAILNPRLLAQSSAYQNRPAGDKDRS
ncbi:hypothetical protein TIFTF001_023430 [Ficus carica]|uniref:TCP domain-containing protein n=1 Tax=Ficus carica TaxID=3494 RepID=A0AA88AJK6_FICCA|nr:hypothetical protein TIFTF001_023430 [Ficus carica]